MLNGIKLTRPHTLETHANRLLIRYPSGSTDTNTTSPAPQHQTNANDEYFTTGNLPALLKNTNSPNAAPGKDPNPFGSVAGILSKLLENGNPQGMAELIKTIEGLLQLQGLDSKENSTLAMVGNGTDRGANRTAMLKQVMTILSKMGINNPEKVISMVLGNLNSGIGMLGKNENVTNNLGNVLGFLNNTGATNLLNNLFVKPSNTNITDSLGNVAGVLSKLLGSNSAQGMPGIAQLMEGLIQGATNQGHITSGSATNTSLLNAFLPMLSKVGTSSLTNLVPIAAEYLKTNLKLLERKGVSKSCQNDLIMWVTGLQTFQGWAWKLIDSGFKIPPNLAGFNLKWMGDMGECTAIRASAYNNITRQMQEFDGKYCRMLIPLGDLPGAGSQMMVLGSCASSHCSNGDVKIIVDSAMDAIVPKTFTSRALVSCVEEKELDGKAIAVICFLAILGGTVALATLYDVITILLKPDDDDQNSYNLSHSNDLRMKQVHSNGAFVVNEVENGPLPIKHNYSTPVQNGIPVNSEPIVKEKPRQIQSRLVKAILAFSAYTNAKKLLGTGQASGSLSAINGIRFLSMAWVILGHTYYFAANYTSNMFDLGKTKMNQYSFMAILYATPSVDSFFALSGCLVAYLTLRELQKVGGAKKLNWFMFYFHRFWRLTPPYMLIILVGTILYRYIGNGALKPDGDNPFMEPCRDNWWTNLLYINNFVKTERMCMGWTWYLANDMQMYIISPLIFLPLFYNIIVGGVVASVLMIGTIVATAVISHVHEYPVQSASPYAPTKTDAHYSDLMYVPMYTRIGPYIVGLVTGYVLYKYKCKCRIPKVINLCCWFLCIFVTSAIIYGPYTHADSHIMSTNASTAYYTLFRTAWGMAVCWIIFACATGNGGFVNDVLSWSPYVPLGRLTYCAYLLHPLVMMMYYENRMQPIYFTDYDTVYYFLGNLALSYGAAFVISLFFESPMMGLEKAIFKK